MTTFDEFKDAYQKTKVEEYVNSVTEKPLVSVCIQTYQHRDFIRECIESVVTQKTNFAFEILIGEDNSDDGTREICIEYANLFPDKIRLFLHHRVNQIKVMGEPTSNFNALYNLYSTRGSYIAFCEGDDFWMDTQKLQKQVDILKNNSEYILSYHSYEAINHQGNFYNHNHAENQPRKDISSQDLMEGHYHPLMLSVCFRNVLKEFPREITEVINVDTFLLSLLGNYGAAKFLPGIKPAKYRKHQGGIWSNRIKREKFLSKINTYDRMSSFYYQQNNKILYELYNTKKINTYKMLIMEQLRKRQYFKVLKLCLSFLRNNKMDD